MSVTRPVNVAASEQPPQLGEAPFFGPEPVRVALAPGARLGRYEVLAALGAGGMAQVWLAEQVGELGFRKLVALKVIGDEHAANAQVRKMFLDEARIASRIRHANVVDVLDLGEHKDKIFLAMEFVEGASLGAVLAAHGALPVPVAARIALDMLSGLQAAHELRDEDGVELGLVHRDVSPQNVLLGVDGVAKIADFGIAKALGRITEVTQVGQWKGKIRYAAPEQLEGLPATPAMDIFSTGVVLWEVLTGRALFRSAERLVEGNVATDPRAVVRQVPAPIATVVMRALAPRAAERFATAREMAEALEVAARRAGVLASHLEVGAIVKGSVAPALASLREVMRARRRGGPLPAYQAPSAGLKSVAAPAQRPMPQPQVRRTLLGAVGVGSCLAVIVGVMVARTGESSEPPSVVGLARAARGPAPSASTIVPAAISTAAAPADAVVAAAITPTPASQAGAPAQDAPSGDTKSPRRGELRGQRVPKVQKPPVRPPPKPRDSTSDRPTFDNPYE